MLVIQHDFWMSWQRPLPGHLNARDGAVNMVKVGADDAQQLSPGCLRPIHPNENLLVFPIRLHQCPIAVIGQHHATAPVSLFGN